MKELFKFSHKGQPYTAEGQVVETFYGSEMKVIIRNEFGNSVATEQEMATIETIVRWWQERQP